MRVCATNARNIKGSRIARSYLGVVTGASLSNTEWRFRCWSLGSLCHHRITATSPRCSPARSKRGSLGSRHLVSPNRSTHGSRAIVEELQTRLPAFAGEKTTCFVAGGFLERITLMVKSGGFRLEAVLPRGVLIDLWSGKLMVLHKGLVAWSLSCDCLFYRGTLMLPKAAQFCCKGHGSRREYLKR